MESVYHEYKDIPLNWYIQYTISKNISVNATKALNIITSGKVPNVVAAHDPLIFWIGVCL